ncbi:mandelate racemase/muconate lactonizing enzyme family protein [candidate division KSB1 bacterium]
MKITKAECWMQHIKLSEPYTIAYETINYCTNVFMRAETDIGLTGWGCAAPDKYITGETGEDVMKSFNEIIEPMIKGSDPGRYIFLIDELKLQLKKRSSAMAMIDMLLYDLIARKAKLPLYQLLGGYHTSIPTSITIGILPVETTVEKAKAFIRNGFKILKIKGGIQLEEDIEKITKVRNAVGKEVEIRFDANQGYTVNEALEFIKRTTDFQIELLEQPTIKENEELLGKISRNVSVPVMADESLMTLKDVFRLTSNDLVDMINIKLMKVGGITEGMHINSVAKSAGVESMVGCMDESALGISAGLHFALSRPNIVYADLDGHLDLIDDPFNGLIKLIDGILYPGNDSGLGNCENFLK